MLSERAMLAQLRISCWGNTRRDKEATQHVHTHYGTTAESGRYNKTLIKKGAMVDIGAAVSGLREFHHRNTLPWSDGGARVLPTMNYQDYCSGFNTRRERFDYAVRAFVDAYPSLVNEARGLLGDLFKESDYPLGGDIVRKFGVSFDVWPFPDPQDFRACLDEDETRIVQAHAEQRINLLVEDAMRDTWCRLEEAVARIKERASTPECANFRQTLLDSVREVVEVVPRLNLTGDKNLDATVEGIQNSLLFHDAATLRDAPELRAEVAAQADAILKKMAGYMGAAA